LKEDVEFRFYDKADPNCSIWRILAYTLRNIRNRFSTLLAVVATSERSLYRCYEFQ